MNLDLSLSLSPRKNLSGGYGWPTFAPGSKLIVLGDSLMAKGYTSTSTGSTITTETQSIVTFALRDCPNFKHVIYHDAAETLGASPNYYRGAVFAYQGYSATDLYGAIGPALNSGADVAVVLIGTNTGTTDASSAATVASIDNIIAALRSAGMFICIGTILPRTVAVSPTGGQITPSRMAQIILTNEYIRTLNAPDIAVWDAWEYMRDPAYNPGDTLYGTVKAGMTEDDVHLLPLGGNTAAIDLRRVLQAISGTSPWSNTWFNSNPSVSNLLSNGSFTGTSGSKFNNVTGTMATNWIAGGGTTNSSAVASLVANSNTGGYTQRFAITSLGDNPASNDTDNLYLTPAGGQISYASLSSGDWFQTFFKVKVSGNSAGVLGSLTSYTNNTTDSKFSKCFDASSVGLKNTTLTTDDFEMWLQIEPMQWFSGKTYFHYLFFQVLKAYAGTVTVDVEAAMIRKVEDPTVLFPFIP